MLERFLARLAAGPHADQFVLKGGMLLAVWQARRATVDGDFLARNMHVDEASVLDLVREIAATAPPVEDGVEYLIDTVRSGTTGRAASTAAYASVWMRSCLARG